LSQTKCPPAYFYKQSTCLTCWSSTKSENGLVTKAERLEYNVLNTSARRLGQWQYRAQ